MESIVEELIDDPLPALYEVNTGDRSGLDILYAGKRVDTEVRTAKGPKAVGNVGGRAFVAAALRSSYQDSRGLLTQLGVWGPAGIVTAFTNCYIPMVERINHHAECTPFLYDRKTKAWRSDDAVWPSYCTYSRRDDWLPFMMHLFER